MAYPCMIYDNPRQLYLPTYPAAEQKQLWTLLTSLQHGERLTCLEAAERHGIWALSQRVGQLKKLNWPVQSEWHKTATGAKIKRYFL